MDRNASFDGWFVNDRGLTGAEVVVFTDGGVRPQKKQAAAAWIIHVITRGTPCRIMEGAATIPFHGDVSSFVAETIAIDYAVSAVNSWRPHEPNQSQLFKQRLTYKAPKRKEVMQDVSFIKKK